MQNHNQTWIFNILPSNKQRRERWLQATGRAQQRLRFCNPRYLVSQLNAKELYFSSFVKSMHQIFTQMYLIKVYLKSSLLVHHPIFTYLNLPTNIPQTGTCYFNGPPPSPSLEGSPGDKWTQSLITNFFSTSQITTSKIYRSKYGNAFENLHIYVRVHLKQYSENFVYLIYFAYQVS